eukprot:TRINITY_DN22135_c0_g1_i1.p1 TRINITY_DN22135_c0_g1~~TRINITY_DN22135_c0_g1_i1.p1  ORF type:complete len:362 (+),score=107.63 TRINITY_DN22135_c0_g1_i1:44-1087(+)
MSDKIKRCRDEERFTDIKNKLNGWKERFTETFGRPPTGADLEKQEHAAVKRLKTEFDELKKIPRAVNDPNLLEMNEKLKRYTTPAPSTTESSALEEMNQKLQRYIQSGTSTKTAPQTNIDPKLQEMNQKLQHYIQAGNEKKKQPPKQVAPDPKLQEMNQKLQQYLGTEKTLLKEMDDKLQKLKSAAAAANSSPSRCEIQKLFDSKKEKWKNWTTRYQQEFGSQPTQTTLQQPAYKEAKRMYEELRSLKERLDSLKNTEPASSKIEKVQYSEEYGYEDEEYFEEQIEEETEELMKGMDETFAFSININGVRKDVKAEITQPPAFEGFSVGNMTSEFTKQPTPSFASFF